MANVHHHLAVAVPKTFHTPRPMSYWNEMSEMSAVLYLPPPPVTPCSCTTHAPCWGLYKAQLVDQPGRNAQSMRHLPHTETLCSPTTNPGAFYRIVPWYRAVGTDYRSGLRGSGSLEPPALRGCVQSLVTFRQTRARTLRLALSSRELGNESTKWGTVRSQRPGDEIWASRVAGDTLADRVDAARSVGD